MSLTVARAIELYGDPGHGDKPDPAWVKANIVGCGWDGRAELPSMPGVPPHTYLSVHRKVEPAMRRAFSAAHEACPDYVIVTAGCFVFRHQRWDTIERAQHEHRALLPLSNHSWGAAVDINASTNAAHEFGVVEKPHPWTPPWKARWPHGLPRAFVEAFEAEGFSWGGRWHGYVDVMHLELVNPR